MSGGETSRVIRLRVPKGVAAERARHLVRTLASNATVDLDHFYYPDGDDRTEPICTEGSCETASLVGLSDPGRLQCGETPTIGMIDTAVDLQNEWLRTADIEVVTQRGEVPRSQSGTNHGTTIASLLVGRGGNERLGLLPGAHVIAIDAFFHDDGNNDKTDAASLVDAIHTLTDRGVKVINLSLSGPPNAILENAINNARTQGVVFIAAAGNGGPGAEPSYPAAYPGVIAVTAVDRNLAIYRRASQGSYISLSAPGVHIRPADGRPAISGTSYAVPFVTAAAALLRARDAFLPPESIALRLEASARDLGQPGYDTTFGWGLLQAQSLCPAPHLRGPASADARTTLPEKDLSARFIPRSTGAME